MGTAADIIGGALSGVTIETELFAEKSLPLGTSGEPSATSTFLKPRIRVYGNGGTVLADSAPYGAPSSTVRLEKQIMIGLILIAALGIAVYIGRVSK